MNSTTQDLAEQLLTSLGGNLNDVQGKYLSTTNDILEACIEQVGNGLGGNSSNIQIPIPQIHIGSSVANPHSRNDRIDMYFNIPSNKGGCNEFPPISLFWAGSNTNFLQHDPHYFLFKYVKKGQGQGGNKRNIIKSQRNKKTFVHVGQVDRKPANNIVEIDEFGVTTRPYTPLQAMFSNFGGGGNTSYGANELKNFIKIGDTKQTEWAVNENPFALSPLFNFKAKHYYKNKDSGNFFPIHDFADNSGNVLNTFIGLPKNQPKKRLEKIQTPRLSLSLVLKFAIVIRNPIDPTKYILGGFSDSLIIKPQKGFFSEIGEDNDGVSNQMYWYKWSAMIK